MSHNMSFQDVLDALMLEEPAPTHEALERWAERYPQYYYALAEFFATWAIQKYHPEPPPEIDEEAISQQGLNHVMDIVRRQGRLTSPESIGPLREYDQLVLATVYLFNGKGYVINIARSISEILGKEALLASINLSLDRLEQKALVLSLTPDPETVPEHWTYYSITVSGKRALATAKETSAVLARVLEDFA